LLLDASLTPLSHVSTNVNFSPHRRFPWKLHIMLDHMEEQGDKSIVCWQPHGRAFTVHKPKEFVVNIMPQFFNQTKYASFQRQLNLYGFSRLTHGPDKGAYYHSCFVRGERNLCRNMIRQKIKGTKVRKTLAPEEEPNFYNMKGKLPMIPSQDSIAEPTQPKSPLHTPQISPVAVKPAKRSLSSDCSKKVKKLKSITDSPAAAYGVLPAPLFPFLSPRTVSPHHSTTTLQDVQHQLPPVPETVKGGDLLFFEGQPFHYLERIEEIPASSMAAAMNQYHPAPGMQYSRPNNNGSLQDMITNIVNHDYPRSYQSERYTQNACSV
jgi:hypothetical protein